MDTVEERQPVLIDVQGEKIFAVFHRPLLPRKVPAVLVCAGFAGNKCGKYRMLVSLGKELAKRGIAVLRFDYRGAGDSEGEFNHMTFESKVSDALASLRFLVNDPQIEASRIGILGRSLGGAVAVVAAARSGSIKSMAFWASVFYTHPWRDLWEAMQKKQELTLNQAKTLSSLASEIPNDLFLQQLFALDIVKECETLKEVAFFQVHGKLDQVVSFEQAEEFRKTRSGIPNSEFLPLPQTDHDFSDRAERELTLMKTCQWFQRTL